MPLNAHLQSGDEDGGQAEIEFHGDQLKQCFNTMHTQPGSHSRKQANTPFDKTRVRVGYCTGNEQLGFVVAVSVGRGPDRCAVMLRWQDLEVVIAARTADQLS